LPLRFIEFRLRLRDDGVAFLTGAWCWSGVSLTPRYQPLPAAPGPLCDHDNCRLG